MKHILLLSTGGTISCRGSAFGLTPQTDGEQLLGAVPVPAGVRVDVCDLMRADSTDITAEQRLAMARAVWEQREKYDGFVLTHGTDTMAYTAAFLCRGRLSVVLYAAPFLLSSVFSSCLLSVLLSGAAVVFCRAVCLSFLSVVGGAVSVFLLCCPFVCLSCLCLVPF